MIPAHPLLLFAALLLCAGCWCVPTISADGGSEAVDAGDLCERLATARCSSTTQGCCASLGRKYSQASCRLGVISGCEDQLTLLPGYATFEPGKLQACLDAWGAAFATCNVPDGQYFKLLAICAQPINGRTPIGGRCDQLFLNRDCRSPPDGLAICRGQAIRDSTCVLYRSVASEGGSCGGERLCDVALTCTQSSTCQPDQPLGGACGAQLPCGPSLVCDGGRCTPAQPIGASCATGTECASGACSGNLENPNGVCVDAGISSRSLLGQHCD